MNRISTLFVVLLSMIFAMSTSASAEVDYTVKRGDSMFHVGKKFGVPGQEVVRANPSFRDPNLIHPGDKLVIPGGVRVPAGVPAVTSPAPSTAPKLPANVREAEAGALADLQVRLSKAEKRASVLQQGLDGLDIQVGSLREENRNLKEENARLNSALAVQPKPAPPQVPPKVVTPAPVAQGYYLPMWARITPFLLLAALAMNALFFWLWRSQKKKFKEVVSRRAERAEDNRHYDSMAAMENERLRSEIADLGRELSEGSIEGILADREQLRSDRGLPEEERGEVLHAVLGYFFGDLAKDRKSALRALLRFYFPQGVGLHRQDGVEVMIPCSGGKFTLKGGAVNVSFYAQPSGSGQEVDFDNLHRAIESSPELRESLGIPSLPIPIEGGRSSE